MRIIDEDATCGESSPTASPNPKPQTSRRQFRDPSSPADNEDGEDKVGASVIKNWGKPLRVTQA